MKLGAFSISLAVKDIAASRAFYEKLGFTVFGGNQDQRWLIMKNDTTIIGLFQGMFEKNLLTFNPGWDSDAQALASFTDIRDIQKHLKAAGVALGAEVDASKPQGPAHLTLEDPDGNQILIDQHV
ncbi:MAG: VOC family protein [Caulobacterales bacterium]|jgi:predicted lactoylglutathione lyase|nr:VOC family protein [Caulobacterales bacterium]